MRKVLIIVFALMLSVIIGFIARRYTTSEIDLREPIYLIVEKNFFSSCEYEEGIEKELACRESRIKEIQNGANDWFKHFNPTTRPRIVIVYSEDDLPFSPVNSPIYIRLEEGNCGLTVLGGVAAACHRDPDLPSPGITFNTADDITASTFAHELGHALGRTGGWHDDTPAGVYSVMSYTNDSDRVLPIDIKILCEMHPECPPHEDTWCRGGFWDPDRCPSSSYEEGERDRKAQEDVPKFLFPPP